MILKRIIEILFVVIGLKMLWGCKSQGENEAKRNNELDKPKKTKIYIYLYAIGGVLFVILGILSLTGHIEVK
jgi:uncharacterized membrane protein YfcA